MSAEGRGQISCAYRVLGRVDPAAHRLSMHFAEQEQFEKEYATNIVGGSVFIACQEALPDHSAVRVSLHLAYCGQTVVIGGSVLHRVAPELAGPTRVPGVAIQLDPPRDELREALAPFVSESCRRSLESDRRSSMRVPSELSATVTPADGSPGCTASIKNLSRTGALVQVHGAPIPVGTEVSVSILDPRTEQEVTVGGRVARHDPRIEHPPTLGIHFTPPGERTKEIDLKLDALCGAEHGRRLGGISGSIEEVGLPNLLQAFGLSSSQGSLTLTRADMEGSISFRDGSLTSIRLEGASGLKALVRLLQWPDGTFHFRAQAEPAGTQTAALSLEGALLDAMRLMDEGARLGGLPWPEDAVVRARPELFESELAASVESGSGDSEVRVALLQALEHEQALSELLDALPQPDPEILSALRVLERDQLIEIKA